MTIAMTMKAGSLARRTLLHATYNNQSISESISSYLTGFTFSDTISGQGDSFSFALADRERKWMNKWKPQVGASIYASATMIGWNDVHPTKEYRRKFGYFDVTGVSIKGPPNAVTISAISIPKGADSKTKRTKSYEKTNLRKVAEQIAKRLGVKLLFHSSTNTTYDRIEQSRENDLVFLKRIAGDAGCSVKISTKYLSILDEAELESRDIKDTLVYSEKYVKDYSFDETLTGIYRQCVVSYTNSKTKKTVKVVFKPTNAPKKGDTLFVNEEFKTHAAGLRIAKNKLREANKEAVKGSIKYVGFFNLYAGDTVNVKGYGQFDGKYLIVTINGSVGGGTETSFELRKVLRGY